MEVVVVAKHTHNKQSGQGRERTAARKRDAASLNSISCSTIAGLMPGNNNRSLTLPVQELTITGGARLTAFETLTSETLTAGGAAGGAALHSHGDLRCVRNPNGVWESLEAAGKLACMLL